MCVGEEIEEKHPLQKPLRGDKKKKKKKKKNRYSGTQVLLQEGGGGLEHPPWSVALGSLLGKGERRGGKSKIK